MRYLLACLSCAVLFNSEASASSQDSCGRALPRGIPEAVQREYPAYRLPLESDNLPEDIRVNRENGGSRWRLELLRDWGGGRGVMYVASARPGKYTRFGGFDGPLGEPGELSEFVNTLPGILSGRVESSGVAYFFTGKKWVHVWVSD